jgi:hypothetical protein
MEWLSENWVWVVVGVAFVAMHLFGHGGHGAHGGHGGGRRDDEGRKDRKDDEPAAPRGGHRH